MRVASILVLGAALAAGGCDRAAPPAPQGNATAAVSADEVQPDEARADAPVAKPGAIDRSHAGEAAPDHPFADAGGKTRRLADFRGRPVLVNLWATWCAPCIRELPTLDRLAARDGARLHVLAISQDMDAAKVAPFVAARGLKSLATYTDPKMAWTPAVTATLPTTILYDSAGREAFRVVGELDWAGPEAAKAIAGVR
ncbi:Thiol-disulfide isomerase or thioredoxin [Sphingomonas guangdongensis]|uniref:Thiol-disulfide isomerase or thioredoxin n=1 Tax=Sphingomonas guangdongensis TaxID=1141890 RepID=A0A285QJ72_9SPHN|nr:TlpA disulfide reductase family protein [Sphingomonas guangdongensis]SOB80122.1 Thiol-disulfide isomerase or thioredoxin [Sphingomonas guangdongensis]